MQSPQFNESEYAPTAGSSRTRGTSLRHRAWTIACTGVFVAVLVQTGTVNHALREQGAAWARAESAERIDQIASNVQTYLEDRIHVLEDLSRHPVLLQELQNPGRYLEPVATLLNERTVLGDQPHLSLVDGWGQILHQTKEVPGSAEELPDLVNSLLNLETTKVASIQTIGEETFLCLAAPVTHADKPEGAVVLNYPLHEFQRALGLQRPLESASLSIAQRDVVLWVLGEPSPGEAFQSEVAGTEFTLLLTKDPYRVLPGFQESLGTIRWGLLALALLLGGTLVGLVKRWCVSPVAELKRQTQDMGRVDDLEALTRRHPIEEIHDLALFVNGLAARCKVLEDSGEPQAAEPSPSDPVEMGETSSEEQ